MTDNLRSTAPAGRGILQFDAIISGTGVAAMPPRPKSIASAWKVQLFEYGGNV
jgi:hypothetical protein